MCLLRPIPSRFLYLPVFLDSPVSPASRIFYFRLSNSAKKLQKRKIVLGLLATTNGAAGVVRCKRKTRCSCKAQMLSPRETMGQSQPAFSSQSQMDFLAVQKDLIP